MASPQADVVVFGGSANGIPAGARWRSAVDPSEPIMFSIRLRPPDGVPATPPDRPNDLGAGDGAEAEPQTQGDELARDAVQEFAHRTGLLIVDVNRPERRVWLWGAAADVGAALRTSLVHYEQHGRVRRGTAGPIYLPPRLATVVEDISGLDDSLPDWVSSAIMSRAEPRVSSARFRTSRALLVGGAMLIGVGVLLYWAHAFGHPRIGQDNKATQVAARLPAGVPPSAPTAGSDDAPASPAPNSTAIVEEPAKFEAVAWSALDAGRLREAQDNFLNALAADPGRAAATHGLITVRQRMAEDNPVVVREQLAEYQKAIDRGTPADQYPLSSLKILVSAGLAAARELEARPEPTAPSPPVAAPAAIGPVARQAVIPARGDAPRNPAEAPSVPAKRSVPARGDVPRNPAQPPSVPAKRPVLAAVPPVQRPPAVATPPKPVVPVVVRAVPLTPGVQRGPTPGSASAAPVTQPQAAPAGVRPQALPANHLYAVQITLLDRDRATVLVKQLSAGGFPQAQMSAQPGYRVLSEPLARKTAESLAATMAGRGFHADLEPLTGDTVQLLFGTFASQKDAEALSGRITGAGYDAWIREATVYTIRLGGPYPTPSVTAITGIVRTNAPEAAVAADPVP
jgi:hypothetical protein